MRHVTPRVTLVGHTMPDYEAMLMYLSEEFGGSWHFNASDDHGASMSEFAGRLCYKSWAPGINPNVSRVRESQDAYIANVIASEHGSVLEHVTYNFLLQDVSRILTHEMVRHRAGTAFSQESLRFVRVQEIPFWFPEWALADDELLGRSVSILHDLEEHQEWMRQHFGITDAMPFSRKKKLTSFMRRFLPEGLATQLLMTVNARELRHIMVARTSRGAEEEIQLIARLMGDIARVTDPLLYADISFADDGQYVTQHPKI